MEELKAIPGIPGIAFVHTMRGGHPKEQGTWVHRDLAIHIAMWVSPKFAIRVSRWIGELLICGNVIYDNERPSEYIENRTTL